MLYGVGIDMVDVTRFKSAMERRGERFLKRLFTEKELCYCLAKRFPEKHLAARFAAKTSLIKAAGRTIRFLDMEITSVDGRPVMEAKGLGGAYRINLSMTHDGDLSIAETILEKTDEAC